MNHLILLLLCFTTYSTQLAASCYRYRVRAKVEFNAKYPHQLQLIIYQGSRSQRTLIVKKQEDVLRLAPFIHKVVQFEGSITSPVSNRAIVHNTKKVTLTITDPLNLHNDLIKLQACK